MDLIRLQDPWLCVLVHGYLNLIRLKINLHSPRIYNGLDPRSFLIQPSPSLLQTLRPCSDYTLLVTSTFLELFQPSKCVSLSPLLLPLPPALSPPASPLRSSLLTPPTAPRPLLSSTAARPTASPPYVRQSVYDEPHTDFKIARPHHHDQWPLHCHPSYPDLHRDSVPELVSTSPFSIAKIPLLTFPAPPPFPRLAPAAFPSSPLLLPPLPPPL